MTLYRLSTGLQPIPAATPAQAQALIGAGIAYRGDMANPSGVGAVVGVSDHSICGAAVEIVLEDGRRLQSVLPADIVEKPGSRYTFDGRRHGADYVAQLLAAEAGAKASRSAAAELASAAFARAVVELKAAHPYLSTDPADPAKNMRAALKRAFPGVKFSVRRPHYSSIDVRWTDGPTRAQVEAVADRFEAGHFDGMIDCYEYKRTPWGETFGSVQYVSCDRDHSDALIARAIAAAVAEFGERDAPTVEDWRAGRCWRTYPGDSFADGGCGDHWSWQSIVSRAAAELVG